jgi:hypothetical protein
MNLHLVEIAARLASSTLMPLSSLRQTPPDSCQTVPRPFEPWISYWAVNIAFGIMPWMPLLPSTTWVT